tara:strand:+ start:48 stop:185 length:138 start_codon:yes stop_codon:yes gene_type:complete
MNKKVRLLAIGLLLSVFGFEMIPYASGYAFIALGGFLFGWGLGNK